MMKRLIAILAICTLLTDGFTQEPTRWRGPSRDGHYPETGLLKQWPAGGPEIIWSFEDLGQGHSSAIVDQGFDSACRIFCNTGQTAFHDSWKHVELLEPLALVSSFRVCVPRSGHESLTPSAQSTIREMPPIGGRLPHLNVVIIGG